MIVQLNSPLYKKQLKQAETMGKPGNEANAVLLGCTVVVQGSCIFVCSVTGTILHVNVAADTCKHIPLES